MNRFNCFFTCKAFCPERIEDTVKIVNEAIKDKIQVNLIINIRAGGNAPQISQNIAAVADAVIPIMKLLVAVDTFIGRRMK